MGDEIQEAMSLRLWRAASCHVCGTKCTVVLHVGSKNTPPSRVVSKQERLMALLRVYADLNALLGVE